MSPAQAGCAAYVALTQVWLRLAAACERDAGEAEVASLLAEAQALLDAIARLAPADCTAAEAATVAAAGRQAEAALARAEASASGQRERLRLQIAALPGRDAARAYAAAPPVPRARFLDEHR